MARKSKVSSTKQEAREARRRRERQQKLLKWGGLGLLALLIAGAVIWFSTRPVTAMGEGVIVTARNHVPEGTRPGPFQTNPPTGGNHYAGTFQKGFYDESRLESLPQFHEGYLVHNLEHGYIIFWYNCEADSDLSCDELKQTIRDVMDTAGTDEVIAFPWKDQKEPLVMTSWERIMRFDKLDPDAMRQFVKLYHDKSPEPAAN